ncbi:MAG: hypothetical protein WCS37_00575 [Chloroflexota bacterium]|nr:hypothetical protein [Chloroflexota bacterium]
MVDAATATSISPLAVAGAWIATVGVLFAILSFCFGVIRPTLFRAGVTYLFIADAGLILMLGTLLVISQDDGTWVFSILGLVIAIALTVGGVIAVRTLQERGDVPQVTALIENTRQRIEF